MAAIETTHIKPVVIITGSSRGIGYHLAQAFLEHGCSVTISGHNPERLSKAYDQLKNQFGEERLFSQIADVGDFNQVQTLWDQTMRRFQRVDIWINNAGETAPPDPMWQQDPATIASIYRTNLLGLTYGCLVAVQGMRRQGFGAIYNLEGAGSDGRSHPGLTLYGTTKYAVRFLTDSIAKELQDTSIIIAAIRPGMVITDLILAPYQNRPQEWERFKKVINIIAEHPQVIAPRLAEKILQNKCSRVRIKPYTSFQILLRTIKRMMRHESLV
ncbi:MAG: SDR family oxidoreductase [Anaerolineales bacterium]